MAADSIPTATDLRNAAKSIADWGSIGPCVLDAIVKCVDDVCGRLERRPDMNPAALLIHYGQQVIAGTAPIAVQPRRDQAGRFDGPNTKRIAARTPMIDTSTSYGFATLRQLKTSLAKGQPFSFLFLRGEGDDGLASPIAREYAQQRGTVAGQAHTATAIGYDDSQQAFMVVKRSTERTQSHDFSDIMLLSYAYVTHPLLSQDVWTIRTA